MKAVGTWTVRAVTLVVLSLVAATQASAIQISITSGGTWTANAVAPAQAGADIGSAVTSAANQVVLRVRNQTARWRVDVRKVDSSWSPALHLYVRRTSSGSPTGNLTGGTSYQELTSTATELFRCPTDVSVNAINLQLELRGLTAILGARSFQTTVYYTVTQY